MRDKITITLLKNDKGQWEFVIKSNTSITSTTSYENMEEALEEAKDLTEKLKKLKEELKKQMELF